jgi:hypothetical protein
MHKIVNIRNNIEGKYLRMIMISLGDYYKPNVK